MDPVTADLEAWRTHLREAADQLHRPSQILRELLRDILARGTVSVGAADGTVLVPDEDRKHLRFLVCCGRATDRLAGRKVPIAQSLVGQVYGSAALMVGGQDEAGSSLRAFGDLDRQEGLSTRAYLMVPLVLEGHVGGVSAYINRPGEPPHAPFGIKDIERARRFASGMALTLRYLQRTHQLAELAARDFDALVRAHDPAAPQPLPPPAAVDNASERVLQELHGLSDRDQQFCADLIALVGRWRERQW
jgi:hypothetical protein